MTEYASEEEAKLAGFRMLGISPEEASSIKPKKIMYEFPIQRTLDVYEVGKKAFGVGWYRSGRRKILYGLWLIDGESIRQV